MLTKKKKHIHKFTNIAVFDKSEVIIPEKDDTNNPGTEVKPRVTGQFAFWGTCMGYSQTTLILIAPREF